MNSQELTAMLNQTSAQLDKTCSGMRAGAQEAARVCNVLQNTPQILNDLDEEFCRNTCVTKIDAVFLFLSIGILIACEYLL